MMPGAAGAGETQTTHTDSQQSALGNMTAAGAVQLQQQMGQQHPEPPPHTLSHIDSMSHISSVWRLALTESLALPAAVRKTHGPTRAVAWQW